MQLSERFYLTNIHFSYLNLNIYHVTSVFLLLVIRGISIPCNNFILQILTVRAVSDSSKNNVQYRNNVIRVQVFQPDLDCILLREYTRLEAVHVIHGPTGTERVVQNLLARVPWRHFTTVCISRLKSQKYHRVLEIKVSVFKYNDSSTNEGNSLLGKVEDNAYLQAGVSRVSHVQQITQQQ